MVEQHREPDAPSDSVSINNIESFCRKCGGSRHHVVLHEKTITWVDDNNPVDGGDEWSTLQCAGCHTITFVHSHWFSEDYEIGDHGLELKVHRDLFPPAPPKPVPDWVPHLALCLKSDEFWVAWLLQDVYSAYGLGAYSLAAMGARAIVDHFVTSRAGSQGNFMQKLKRLEGQALITTAQVQILDTAFDAGSAAAHRGYRPTLEDFNILLDITETLIHQICVNPAKTANQAREAEKLKARTPPRKSGR